VAQGNQEETRILKGTWNRKVFALYAKQKGNGKFPLEAMHHTMDIKFHILQTCALYQRSAISFHPRHAVICHTHDAVQTISPQEMGVQKYKWS
jgi:hypothetical protein